MRRFPAPLGAGSRAALFSLQRRSCAANDKRSEEVLESRRTVHVRHLLLTRPLARKETVHSSTTLTDVPMGRARNASWPPGFPLREAPPEDMFAELLVVCDGRKAATKGAGSPPPLPLLPLPFPAHRSSEKGVEMLHIFVASPVEAIRPFLLTTFGARCATCRQPPRVL